MSTSVKALIAISVASAFWSSSGVVSKLLIQSYDPFTVAFLRFLVASIVIIPLTFSKYHVHRQTIMKLIPVALFSTGNILFFYLGLAKTTASVAAVIYSASPLLVLVMANRFINENSSLQKIFGICVGFIGTLLIILLPLLEKGTAFSGNLQGNILILIAVCCWSLYTISSRHVLKNAHTSPLVLSAVSIVTSAVVFGILSSFHGNIFSLYLQITLKQVLLILHLGIFVTVCTYLLYQWVLSHSSTTLASLTNYLQPVLAVALSSILLGEKITTGFIVGSILVIIGVVITSGKQTQQQLQLFTHILWRKNK